MVAGSPKSWEGAKAHCEHLGGHLMEVRTQEQYDDAVRIEAEIDTRFWLGGCDVDEEGSFVWASDGERVDSEFWADGEPNNDDGEEDCIEMLAIGFNDNSCSAGRPFVCVIG